LLSLLLTSFLVFVFGVYVGKEVEAHKAIQQARTAKLPASTSGESTTTRSIPPASGTGSSLSAEKSETPPASSSLPGVPSPQNLPAAPSAAVVVAQKKTPPILPNSEAAIPAVPKPQPDLASAPEVTTATVPPKTASSSPITATVAAASKPRLASSSTPTAAP